MRSNDYKAAAKNSLAGQWGTFALLVFNSGLLTMLALGGIGLIFGTNNSLISILTQLFLTFAFSYGILYASVYTVRGGKAKVGMIFSVFNDGRYLSLLLVHLIEWLARLVFSFLFALPFIGILGFGALLMMALTYGSAELVSNIVGSLSAVTLLTFVFLVILSGVSMLVKGFFQVVVLTRLDFPEMKFNNLFSYAFTILKGRLWELFVLQFSFIGWYLLGIFIFPLLWIIPYKIVAISEFYDGAKEHHELKKI